MGPDLAGPDLAAAVSGAGGLGLMQARLSPPADFREQIQRVREATDKPFGVNFILALPHEENLSVCLEEHVPVISFFWGDPARYVERVHAAGSRVFLQVGSVEAELAFEFKILAHSKSSAQEFEFSCQTNGLHYQD
jgi:NAD(P)H-dependent flavin oxidoreductase YrpB (nitropropane dioxygenase family)